MLPRPSGGTAIFISPKTVFHAFTPDGLRELNLTTPKLVSALMSTSTIEIPLPAGQTIGGKSSLLVRASVCRFGIISVVTATSGIPWPALKLQNLFIGSDPTHPLYPFRAGLVGCVNVTDSRNAILIIMCPALLTPNGAAMEVFPAAILPPPGGSFPKLACRQNLALDKMCPGGDSCPVPKGITSHKPFPHGRADPVFFTMIESKTAAEEYAKCVAMQKLRKEITDARSCLAVATFPEIGAPSSSAWRWVKVNLHDFHGVKNPKGRTQAAVYAEFCDKLKGKINRAKDRFRSEAAQAAEPGAWPSYPLPPTPAAMAPVAGPKRTHPFAHAPPTASDRAATRPASPRRSAAPLATAPASASKRPRADIQQKPKRDGRN